MNTIEGLPFSLFDMETVINRRKYDLASKYLIDLLEFFENADFIERRYVDINNKDNNEVYTRGFYPFSNRLSPLQKSEYFNRLAGTLTTLLTDPDFEIKDNIFLYLLLFKCHLTAIFGASSFFNMDHILIQRGLCTPERKLNLKTEQDIRLVMAFYTLNSDINIDPATFIAADKLMGSYFYISLLYQCTTIKNTTAEKNLFNLINNYKVIDELQPDETILQMVVNPWMDITYIDNPNKHKLKQKLNDYIKKCLNLIVSAKTIKRLKIHSKKRKKSNNLIIVMERYKSTHAMYRCYQKRIEIIKKHFNVTIATEEGQLDEKNRNGFKNIILIDKNLNNFDCIVNKLLDANADIIWYPSLGMTLLAPILANLRIAPNQVMSLGHPASSCGAEIDHLLPLGVPPQEGGYQQYCTEKICDVYIPDKQYTRPSNFPQKLPEKTINDDIFRISINSAEFKITHYFLSVCAIIESLSPKNLEFHFYQYKSKGAFPYQFERDVRNRFNRVVIHKHQQYSDYLTELANCDLALGTFPFGGSNTNIDLTLLGIPKILMDRRFGDFHEGSDINFFKAINIPELVFANNEQEFIQITLEYINNDELRKTVSEKLKEINVFDFFQISENNETKIIDFFKSIDSDKKSPSKKKSK